MNRREEKQWLLEGHLPRAFIQGLLGIGLRVPNQGTSSVSGAQRVDPQSTASASPGHLLKMQIPRPNEGITHGGVSNLCYNQLFRSFKYTLNLRPLSRQLN